jgi:hypothetical protein
MVAEIERESGDWGFSKSHQSKNKLVVIEEEEERNSMVAVELSKEVGRRIRSNWKLLWWRLSWRRRSVCVLFSRKRE